MGSENNIVHLRQNYQIKVMMTHIKPPIWRRLIVDSRISLAALHDSIQISMGWDDEHMHQFIDRDDGIYGEIELSGLSDDHNMDESLVLLNEVLKNEKDWMRYEYDFGDGWEHKIILEKILPHQKNQLPVVCIKGKRACPPENCGGPWGYQNLLEQLADTENSEDREDLLEWLGGEISPEYFDIDDINEILEDFFENEVFNAKGGLDKELQRIQSTSPLYDASYDLSSEGMALEAMAEDGLSLGDTDLEKATDELLNDPSLPVEIKQLVEGMQEAVAVVAYMDDLIGQSIEAFEQILAISKDKKVNMIASNALKVLDED
ncbi:plasmid pRiA4b ORF-3 family protein [sulfur-oxidizing endosymbiont of Gigantopelta aegis]|uniref:plasmid pRiA4b ORF-3 family protein n=1 Tax=sulfur-oxidizing endosymbiont of Gigantopelta aegis TaxID=2794934 RepID=UPI0024834591|nr:plasmid pRiA4b ORF-3 family protein [sulfur-oxidizing endosymbiont of Gigantopelta aegis]